MCVIRHRLEGTENERYVAMSNKVCDVKNECGYI